MSIHLIGAAREAVMSGLRKSILLLLYVSLSALACSTKCPEEGAFECLKDANGGVEHRACVDGKWIKSTCNASEICTKDGCTALEIATKDGNDALGISAKVDGDARNKRCLETGTTCFDGHTLQVCVKDEMPSAQVCGKGETCSVGECAKVCSNHRVDAGEEAVDCGGSCVACRECRVDSDCGVDGFCDSAVGYVCSKRCRTDEDCDKIDRWDGHFCRGDGRCSPKVFETHWEVKADDLSVVLPFDSAYPYAKCDFQILWGDESEGTDVTTLPYVSDCGNATNRTHQYLEAGRYNVKIIGTYDGWGAFNEINLDADSKITAAATKLRSVLSFGPVGLGKGAFYGATELRDMPKRDVPDASKLDSLEECFAKAAAFDAPIGHWDTSRVTNMSGMFQLAVVFNQPLAAWNTSRVESMSGMFSSAWAFNQPIGVWDTSHVTNVSHMFDGALAFNQAIGKWDTSHVTDMSHMFDGALAFNQAIGKWDTSHVTDMSFMFSKAEAFNQAISKWDTSEVTNIRSMFSGAEAFNQPIARWKMSNVTTMKGMFYDAASFDQDLSSWKLKQDVYMNDIFGLSGISNAHLCILKAKGGAWSEQWDWIEEGAFCGSVKADTAPVPTEAIETIEATDERLSF